MITLNRKTPKEKYNLDLNIRYVKCMHHSGYLNDDFSSIINMIFMK